MKQKDNQSFDWVWFINNLWDNENAQGKLMINGKGGYSNGRYYPYTTNDGRTDIGPGFHYDSQSPEFQEKARSQGFTKEELDSLAQDRLQNEKHFIDEKIIKEGGDPTKVTNDVYGGLFDMYWQLNNGLYNDFPNFWKAVANQDYTGMRRESRTVYKNLKTGKYVPDIGRWEYRKILYFHDPTNMLSPSIDYGIQDSQTQQQPSITSFDWSSISTPTWGNERHPSDVSSKLARGGILSDYLSYLRKHRIRVQ